jgi:hypothetical protein
LFEVFHERVVRFGIFALNDNLLAGEPVASGVVANVLLTVDGFRAGGKLGVVAIGVEFLTDDIITSG